MKTEEGLTISIEETEDMPEEEVKDYSVILNTLQSGRAEANTTKLNGELKAIILKSMKQINVTISLVSYPEIILFEAKNYQGTHYIPLRISPVSKSSQVFNFGPAEWYLNDELKISIDGNLNSEVECIFRWC